MNKTYRWMIPAVATTALFGCGDDAKTTTPDAPTVKTDAEFRTEVIASMQTSISANLADLVTAAQALQAAAPEHGWNVTTDADKAALANMKAAWRKTRIAYEHVEGATAPIFGPLDFTMDARWDDYVADLQAPDTNLFDDTGVTGMHGIERILFSDQIRQTVIDAEVAGPNYVPAAFPITDDEALSFKNKLVQKLITDAQSLHDQWTPAQIDLDFAFDGLVGLMNEQGEKVNLAATGLEESRYADITLFDLRNNLDGTTTIYGLFSPWIQSKDGGTAHDASVKAKFDVLAKLYAATPGDAIPDVPGDWAALDPTPANLATPFGTLWQTVRAEVDAETNTSIVFEMQTISTDVLKLKQLPPE
jgi:iron uptake system component EfeO